MPYNLELAFDLKKTGWKVKIHDNELLEPPHVTIRFKARVSRFSLRDQMFMAQGDSWRGIPDGVRTAILENLDRLIAEWDERFPHNPVNGGDDA